MKNTYGTQSHLKVAGREYEIFHLGKLKEHAERIARLPYSLRVLLENLLRHEDGVAVRREEIEALVHWDAKKQPDAEISYYPARVLLQDFTGVPCVVDLAAMRDAMAKMGGDPKRINPLQPVDLVIDHSVQIDHFGSTAAFAANTDIEFERNRERYSFLRWGQKAFDNFRVVPPGTGICHQVNLEYLARVVFVDPQGRAYPDTLVGTDSHTTMINGLGVLGWGVGGIEAEAAMLGQPVSMLIPQVVGFRLKGKLGAGATATDLVLTAVEMLRKKGVVGKFVEFFGPAMSTLSLANRATLANMAPEYGATMGFFPVDAETLSYLRLSHRGDDQVALVEKYCKEQGLFYTPGAPEPVYSDMLELDLASVEPSLAGPKRPQDRVSLSRSKTVYREQLRATLEKLSPVASEQGMTVADRAAHTVSVDQDGVSYELGHGAVVIAAITSCTNTSNPAVMLGAGLLAKKAVQRGLKVKPWVKTSLAPGSQVVTDYLADAGVLPYLEGLGFHVVGYGCTTCIGNSGPLSERITQAQQEGNLVLASVLSGNRNFEGRVHPLARMNYLASPPLVVAYALAGSMDVDLDHDPLGHDPSGKPVYLRDVWPTSAEVEAAIGGSVREDQFATRYAAVFDGDASWQALATPKGASFKWEPDSTYVRNPPFFENIAKEPVPLQNITKARVLAVLGDSVTTDHISPAGNIAKKSPAATYLIENGVDPKDFNSYGARRGNHEVMMRGTFANIRLRNLLVDVEGGYTQHLPSGEQMSIYDAAMRYQKEGVPLVIIAGKEYGTGSSRDWAAKGTRLLGVSAVIAQSFERIHRSNLIGMGVLPLELRDGDSAESLKLTGRETLSITGIDSALVPGKTLEVVATADDGKQTKIIVKARLDTPNEVEYFRHGGILIYVLRQLLRS